MNVMACLAVLLLAGCETPRTDTDAQPPVTTRPEVTIQASADKVRAAAKKIMLERDYNVIPSATDTLLFDSHGGIGRRRDVRVCLQQGRPGGAFG